MHLDRMLWKLQVDTSTETGVTLPLYLKPRTNRNYLHSNQQIGIHSHLPEIILADLLLELDPEQELRSTSQITSEGEMWHELWTI